MGWVGIMVKGREGMKGGERGSKVVKGRGGARRRGRSKERARGRARINKASNRLPQGIVRGDAGGDLAMRRGEDWGKPEGAVESGGCEEDTTTWVKGKWAS